MPRDWDSLKGSFRTDNSDRADDGSADEMDEDQILRRMGDEYGFFPTNSSPKTRFQTPSTVTPPKRAVHRDLLAATTRLGLKIHQHLAQEAGGRNLVVSPVSVNLAIAMAALGAKGDTRSELARVLGIEGIAENEWQSCYLDLLQTLRYAAQDQELHLANSVWTSDTCRLLPQYEQALKECFAAEAASLSFADPDSVARINRWAEEKTGGKIGKIVDSLDDEELRLILINCVYFKGLWYQPFDEYRTREKTFHGGSGDQQRPFMHMRNNFDYFEDSSVQMVRMDYAGNSSLCMWILLPALGTGLEAFVRNLSPSIWESARSGSKSWPGTLALPRFRLECEKHLNASLQAAGIQQTFDKLKADFTGMSVGPERLFVSDVLQKTYLDVNEKGAEAAAVTMIKACVMFALPQKPPEPFKMVVDRPFFVALGDSESGLLLFTASVWDV